MLAQPVPAKRCGAHARRKGTKVPRDKTLIAYSMMVGGALIVFLGAAFVRSDSATTITVSIGIALIVFGNLLRDRWKKD
jgi:hypothetical protein